MGSAGSVQFDSSAEALARAAESASKPAIIAQLIRKEEIDVATALSLDEPTVDSLVQRRIDGKKIMGALKQMRSALHSSVRDGFCEDPGNVVRRLATACRTGAGIGDRARRAAAGRTDQPSRYPLDRLAGAAGQ